MGEIESQKIPDKTSEQSEQKNDETASLDIANLNSQINAQKEKLRKELKDPSIKESLGQIYSPEELQKIFQELGISSIQEEQNIQTPEGAGIPVMVFGNIFVFEMPNDVNSTQIQSYRNSFKKLEDRTDFKNQINEKTQFQPETAGRISFTNESGQKYIISPDDALLLVTEPTDTSEKRILRDKDNNTVEETQSGDNPNNYTYTYINKTAPFKTIKYSNNQLQEIKTLDEKGQQLSRKSYNNGLSEEYVEYAYDENGKKIQIKKEEYYENGIIKTKWEKNKGYKYFYEDGKPMYQDEKFLARDGSQITLKPKEMSADEYLNILAKNLTTPESLEEYFTFFMQYQPEDYIETPWSFYGDYWQEPKVTLERTKNGVMLGDCDDYSFLARDILRKQGKMAYVLAIPGHATCVWLEKNQKGKYNAYSFSNEGIGKNGGQQVDGFDTSEQAISALMEQYNQQMYDDEEFISGKFIKLLEIFPDGRQVFTKVPTKMLWE